MFDTIKKLLAPSVGLACPRCEKSMAEHDEKACARLMSRRYFFQVAAGAAVVVANAPAIVEAASELVLPIGYQERIAAHVGNTYLTTEQVTTEFLRALRSNVAMMKEVQATYNRELTGFLETRCAVGTGMMRVSRLAS